MPGCALMLMVFTALGMEPGTGTEAPAVVPSMVRWGASAGLGAGPHVVHLGMGWWVAEVAGVVDIDLGRVGLRLNVPLRAGSSFGEPPGSLFQTLYFAGLSAEFRVHFTERVAAGAGVEGELVVLFYDGAARARHWLLGPTVTVLSVRLGEGSSHELSVGGALLVGSIASSLNAFGFFRYAWLF